jgi:acylphosphatase
MSASADDTASQRMTVRFIGHVQGVGFRYTTIRVADRYRVAGYVKNMPDGSVELVAEGEKPELERFLAAVEQDMAGCIQDTKISISPSTGRYDSFDVAY